MILLVLDDGTVCIGNINTAEEYHSRLLYFAVGSSPADRLSMLIIYVFTPLIYILFISSLS